MKTIRVVLDTNVVVSAHLKSEGYERHVLDLVLAGKLQLAASEAILTEYADVLTRAKFGRCETRCEIHVADSKRSTNSASPTRIESYLRSS
jgi:putative PIN family toxin of toxin-antitoxin system